MTAISGIMMSKFIKCGQGILVRDSKPLHLKCIPPGIILRWWYKITNGSVWTCDICNKKYEWTYHICNGTCNLEPGFYWEEK
jgi:hypothetical protein